MDEIEMIPNEHCPETDRVSRTEKSVESLAREVRVITSDVRVLTRDVDRLVKAQGDLVELQRQNAVQMTEFRHVENEVKGLRNDVRKQGETMETLKEKVTSITTEKETAKGIIKHWPIIAALVAAAYLGMVVLGVVTPANGAKKQIEREQAWQRQ